MKTGPLTQHNNIKNSTNQGNMYNSLNPFDQQSSKTKEQKSSECFLCGLNPYESHCPIPNDTQTTNSNESLSNKYSQAHLIHNQSQAPLNYKQYHGPMIHKQSHVNLIPEQRYNETMSMGVNQCCNKCIHMNDYENIIKTQRSRNKEENMCVKLMCKYFWTTCCIISCAGLITLLILFMTQILIMDLRIGINTSIHPFTDSSYLFIKMLNDTNIMNDTNMMIDTNITILKSI